MRLRGRYKNKNFNTTCGEKQDNNSQDELANDPIFGKNANKDPILDDIDDDIECNTNKKDWFKSIDKRTIATFDECHMNLALTIARVRAKFFKQLGTAQGMNDKCLNITKMGQVERFIDKIRDILDTGEDTYFSENE